MRAVTPRVYDVHMTSTTRRRRPVTPCLSRAHWRHRKNQANKVTRREGKAEAKAGA